jgi:hypothetical protein
MASTYLSKTFSSAGDQQIMTISFWMKRSALGGTNEVISQGSGSACHINLQSSGTMEMNLRNSVDGASNVFLITSRLFRDTSAWYHVVLSLDTTQATSSNRAKLYINGVQETSFGTENYPSQNGNLFFNEASAMQIGQAVGGSSNFDGSLAHFHFIDGTAYDADTFGQTETSSGIWKPKVSPSVTYGTNGFFLKFQDSSALGDDSSGNTNDFTVNGTGTQTLDTPSNVFATLNPLDSRSGVVATSNGNLTGTGTTTAWRFGKCSLGITKGKWYFEAKQNGSVGASLGRAVGWVDQNVNGDDDINSGTPPVKFYARQGATLYNNDSGDPSFFSTDSAGDIIGIAFDMDNGKMWFSKNGTWQNSGGTSGDTTTYSSTTLNPSYPDVTGITLDTSAAGVYMPTIVCYGTGASQNLNFGNGYFGTTAVASANSDSAGIGQFEYAVPSGYYALCTKNIAEYG